MPIIDQGDHGYKTYEGTNLINEYKTRPGAVKGSTHRVWVCANPKCRLIVGSARVMQSPRPVYCQRCRT